MTNKEDLIQMRDNASDPQVRALFQTAIEREEMKEGKATQDVIANTLGQISKIIAQGQVSQGSGVNVKEVERVVKTEAT